VSRLRSNVRPVLQQEVTPRDAARRQRQRRESIGPGASPVARIQPP